MRKQKTFTSETEKTLLQLITRELEDEYNYQVDTGENDLWYVKKLLKAEIEIYKIIDKGGIDTYVHNQIIEEDLQKYGNLTIKDLYEE
ncbi:MAG: hypothetical protein IJH20_06620 [Bacilli bacterium]|nr:hypothetical protein [Bacilli bacterium]